MSTDQNLWSAMLPNGDIRSGTLEQLDEACRSGHLDQGTLVRPIHSDRWITLAEVLGGARAASAPPLATGVAAPRASVAAPRASVPVPSAAVAAPRVSVLASRASVPAPPVAPPPAPVDDDAGLWQVRLPNGEVRSGTRQQLVEAFVAGHLHEQMYVLAAGSSQWVPLGTVMGRGEASALPAAFSASPPPAVDPPQALAAPQPPFAAPAAGAPEPPLAAPEPQAPTQESFAALTSSAVEAPSAEHAPSAEQTPPAEHALSAEPAPSHEPAPPYLRAPSAEQAPDSEHGVSAAAQAPSAVPAADERPDLPPAPDGEAIWQVKLTRRQLEEASRAGLLGDDAWVLAAGSDQWVRLGDVRAPLASPETPVAASSSSDASASPGEAPPSNAPDSSLQESI